MYLFIHLYVWCVCAHRFVAGTVIRDKLAAFERLLWRTTRGNLFIKTLEIPGTVRDPQTVRKKMLFCFFHCLGRGVFFKKK